MPAITVRPLTISATDSYDALICAVGFERRARNIAETLRLKGRTNLAIGFPDRHVCSYPENRHWFHQNAFQYSEPTDTEFGELAREIFLLAPAESGGLKIAIDISSFNRIRLATLVDCASEVRRNGTPVIIHFFYSLAAFSAPNANIDPRNQHVGPVTPAFAGWSEDPMLPPYAVLGLGYEHGKALGAIDHLEVSNALAFIPVSPVVDYLEEVVNANSTLLSALGTHNAIRYRVHEPVRTFEMVESAVSGLLEDFNPILLPFGPKIFFAISLLVAKLHPQCSVWRVSAGNTEPAVDRLPSEHVISFEAQFDPS